MSIRSARDVLLTLVWGPGPDGSKVRILDRLSSTGHMDIPLENITHVGRHYLETAEGKIPLHRVMAIINEDGIIWERPSRSR
jgi:uncharacterized protein (UPF0248 family)